jgi:hypothetical protein
MTFALVENGLPWAFLFSVVVLATLAGDGFMVWYAIRQRSVAVWAATVAGVLIVTGVGLAAGLLDLIVISCPPTGCFGD